MMEVGMDGFVDLSVVMRPGVYVLWRKGECMYVGQTKGLLTRLVKHNGEIEFDQVAFRPCRREELDKIEQETIEELKPSLNQGRYDIWISRRPASRGGIPVDFTVNGFRINGPRLPKEEPVFRRRV